MSVSKQAKLVLSLVDGVSGPAGKVASSLDYIDQAIKNADRAINQTRSQLFGAMGTAAAAGAALALPVREAVNFESALADVAKVSGFDDAGLAAFGKQLRELATDEIPMAVNELAALAAAAAQAGVPDADLFDFTRMTAKAATAWEMTGEQTGEALAKIRTQLGLTNEQLSGYADLINTLSDRTASSAPDLINFSRRIAAQGQFFGFAKEDVLGFGAAMISAGAESEVAATSFRNLGLALTRGSSATPRLQRAFKAIGLESEAVAKSMQVDASGTFLDVLDRIAEVPEHMRAALLSDLFGNEARALAPLVTRTEALREALGIAGEQTEYLGSVNKEFAKRAATSEYRLKRFRSQLRDVALVIGDSLLPALNDTLPRIGDVVMRFSKWAEENKQVIKSVTLVGSALLGLRVAGLAGKLAFLMVGKQALIATRAVTALGLGIKGLVTASVISGLTKLRRGMVGFAGAASVIGVRGAAGVALASAPKAILKMLNPLRMVARIARGLGTALKFSAAGIVLTGIIAFAEKVRNNWAGIVEFVEGVGEGFQSAIEPIRPLLDPVLEVISNIYDKVQSWLGPIDATKQEWRGWGVAVGETLGNFVTMIVELPGKIAGVASQFYAVGSDMIQGLWDGAVAKFESFLEWVRGIPGRIRAAIGSITIDNAINFVTGGNEPVAVPNIQSSPIDGARAEGGPVKRGLTYAVGEKGVELFTPRQDGHITSNQDLKSMRGGGVTVHMTNNISLSGRATQEDGLELAKVLDRKLRRSAQTAFTSLRYGDR